jgi:TatA/E family protein of Tat protein translocase
VVFGVGPQELILVLIVVLVLFGPKKLPEMARNMGKAMAEFQKAKEEFVREVEASSSEVLGEDPSGEKTRGGLRAIARNLGIGTEGKSEEELLREIQERTRKGASVSRSN